MNRHSKMAGNKNRKTKIKKETVFALDTVCEMAKMYHHSTIATQNNSAHFKHFKKLAELTPKHIWSYLRQKDHQQIISQRSTDGNSNSLKEGLMPDKFGLLYQFSEAQHLFPNEADTFSYHLLAITIAKKNDSYIIRNHRFIINKGWIPDPHHFILPIDFLKIRESCNEIELSINYDFDVGINLDDSSCEAEISYINLSLNILYDFWYRVSQNPEALSLIKEKVFIFNSRTPTELTFTQLN